jgi:hypothetical protein
VALFAVFLRFSINTWVSGDCAAASSGNEKMKRMILFIEHDNALFFNNENARLIFWTRRLMCVQLL